MPRVCDHLLDSTRLELRQMGYGRAARCSVCPSRKCGQMPAAKVHKPLLSWLVHRAAVKRSPTFPATLT